MRTRKSSRVRVVKSPKCPCNCAVPHDATNQASTRTRSERKQKENSPNLQKSTKTGQIKSSKKLQKTKQEETSPKPSPKLSRNKAPTQTTQNMKKSMETTEHLVRKAQLNNNKELSESEDVIITKQAETSSKPSKNKTRTQPVIKTKPSKTLQNTKQVETSPRLSRNKAQTQTRKTTKSDENLQRKSRSNNNNKPSEAVFKKCYVLLQQLPEEVINKKLTQKGSGKDMQQCDTLSRQIDNNNKPVSSDNLPISLQHKVRRNVAFNPIISQNKPKESIPSSKLRKRKTMNYAESSLEMSQEKPIENRVPIYKLNINNETKAKPHKDTYEFDSSDCEKRTKKKKRKLEDSSSDEYNKTITEILKNIAKRVRKRKNGILPKKRQNNVIKTKPARLKQQIAPQPTQDKDCNKNVLKTVDKRPQPTQDKDCNKKTIETASDGDDDDDDVDNIDFNHCFGFKENAPKIKILSDIHLKPNKELNMSLGTPSKFRESRPNANSTMLNNVLTPWRFNDINIKRNPHFITLKESSLPCISQEMVLDHSMVDKFGDQSKLDATNRVIGRDIRKTPVQKRVTDYFACNSINKLNNEDKENLQVSLFDSDMFSPIKSSSQFITSRVESVKRKILGEKTDNIQVSTPIQNVSIVQSPLREKSENFGPSNQENNDGNSKESENRDKTYFGFDSMIESDDQVTPKKNKNEKPFRFSVNMNDKKYTRKPKQPRKLTKRAELPVVSSDDESSSSVQEDHNGEYRLFDDFDDTFEGDTIQELGIIKKKRTRRRLNDDGQNPYYQRRKDMRTKEEEEEAEKWATAFNSLCEEIEEFPLEIE